MTPDTPVYGWFGLNRALFSAVNGLHAPWWDAFNAAISRAGSAETYALWIALALLVGWVFPKRLPQRNVVAFATGFLVTALLVQWIKAAADFPRPVFVLGRDAVTVIGKVSQTGSFPSGHSAFAFLAAATLSAGLPRPVRLMFWGFAGLVALSRLVVGEHFPADVAGGAILGAAVGWAAMAALGRIRPAGSQGRT